MTAKRDRRLRRISRCYGAGVVFLLSSCVWADQQTGTNSTGNPNAAISRTANLDFIINIGKMIFLRVGTGSSFTGGVSGSGPAANATVDTISFAHGVTIPAANTTPTNGSNRSVSWSGGAPNFTATSPSVALPVEVRSNGGQVRITGQATTPLTSGSNTIPMSSIVISSSDTALPAPVIPNAGISTAVLVTPGGTGTGAAPTLLTYRTATWTFAYAPTATTLANTAAGVYSGTITFTASAP